MISSSKDHYIEDKDELLFYSIDTETRNIFKLQNLDFRFNIIKRKLNTLQNCPVEAKM